jgi:hypothetical protein
VEVKSILPLFTPIHTKLCQITTFYDNTFSAQFLRKNDVTNVLFEVLASDLTR